MIIDYACDKFRVLAQLIKRQFGELDIDDKRPQSTYERRAAGCHGSCKAAALYILLLSRIAFFVIVIYLFGDDIKEFIYTYIIIILLSLIFFIVCPIIAHYCVAYDTFFVTSAADCISTESYDCLCTFTFVSCFHLGVRCLLWLY